MEQRTNSDISRVSQLLTEAGIKLSVQRIAVTAYMLSHRTHPTADEIYRALLPDYPTISRTTVYNTLNRLVEAGKIRSLGIDRANTRFDGLLADHAHFVCTSCGSISDVGLTEMPKAPEGCEVNEIQVIFHGLCHKCANN